MKRKRIKTDKTDKTATTPKITPKTETTTKTEPKEEKKMKNHEMVTISGSMSRTVNLGDFESAKIEFSVIKQNLPADSNIEAGLDALFEIVEAKVDEKLKSYEDMADEVDSDEVDLPKKDSKITPPEEKSPEEKSPEEESPEEEEEDSPEEEDSEEDDITEEVIMLMKRKELIELIEKEKIEDFNHKDHKKIGDLRTAVINALFEEEGDDSSGSDEDNETWDDESWDDDED